VTPEEPCVSLRITQRRITGHCGATQKAAGQAVLGPPFVGAASLVLTVGADSKRYCALFGGTTIKNEQSQNVSFLRVNADPPGACPPPPTTTTTMP
jgi:hypothetical protein